MSRQHTDITRKHRRIRRSPKIGYKKVTAEFLDLSNIRVKQTFPRQVLENSHSVVVIFKNEDLEPDIGFMDTQLIPQLLPQPESLQIPFQFYNEMKTNILSFTDIVQQSIDNMELIEVNKNVFINHHLTDPIPLIPKFYIDDIDERISQRIKSNLFKLNFINRPRIDIKQYWELVDILPNKILHLASIHTSGSTSIMHRRSQHPSPYYSKGANNIEAEFFYLEEELNWSSKFDLPLIDDFNHPRKESFRQHVRNYEAFIEDLEKLCLIMKQDKQPEVVKEIPFAEPEKVHSEMLLNKLPEMETLLKIYEKYQFHIGIVFKNVNETTEYEFLSVFNRMVERNKDRWISNSMLRRNIKKKIRYMRKHSYILREVRSRYFPQFGDLYQLEDNRISIIAFANIAVLSYYWSLLLERGEFII